jgi:UDP-N-acetylglucosamine transferase subunit ALG13
MIFVTVGSQFPLDRLIKTVDSLKGQGKIDHEIFAQIGESQYQPKNFKYSKFLDKNIFDQYVLDADAIISHAGMGIISKSLELKKPLLTMPRLAKYNEVVNDHQVGIAGKFEQLGHILVAYSPEELLEKFPQLETFVPKARIASPEKIAREICVFLEKAAG